MKKIVEVDSASGLESLLGESVLIFCMNYIYAGTLSGISEDSILLTKAKIVYETGDFNTPGYTDAQTVPSGEWYVQKSSVESFGKGK